MLRGITASLLAGLIWLSLAGMSSGQQADGAAAQADLPPLVFATVERPPFAMRAADGTFSGFSLQLIREVADELGRDVEFVMVDAFPEMFEQIMAGNVDGAVANISITAEREQVMDFSQPIFDAGIQIMVPDGGSGSSSLLSALWRWELLVSVILAFVFLLAGGMLMWVFEHRRQPYFDRDAKDAVFPSFWWALNLVVNGGFEERVPQSRAGRIFATFLVVSSLFIVSIFVAQITAAMTVQAIEGSISSISDLEGKRVATTRGSTTSAFLDDRGIDHARVEDMTELLDLFESGAVDAVVFDGPILAYYIQNQATGSPRLIPQVFRRESYGVALPQGSALTEDINRGLLELRESGEYDEIRRAWFGSTQ